MTHFLPGVLNRLHHFHGLLNQTGVKSDTANLMLFDGRGRAQNAWFVLRSLVPSGKTTGAIVWHIRPDVIPNWTRPPMIAHSQVGYAPGFSKIAVLELDPKYDAPKTARVLRLMEDGSYNNRAGDSYIPGAVIPGYIIINPDFPECIDDFGFLWFEHEAVVASWVVAGNAAAAIVRELK
jgi:hypothetical protein